MLSPLPDDVTPVLIPALEALNYLGIGVFAASGAGRGPGLAGCDRPGRLRRLWCLEGTGLGRSPAAGL